MLTPYESTPYFVGGGFGPSKSDSPNPETPRITKQGLINMGSCVCVCVVLANLHICQSGPKNVWPKKNVSRLKSISLSYSFRRRTQVRVCADPRTGRKGHHWVGKCGHRKKGSRKQEKGTLDACLKATPVSGFA